MKSSLSYKENLIRKYYIHGAMFGPFSFINVFSGKEVLDAENGMKNMVEVAVATRIVQLLYKECASSKHKISIAVLSPYNAQLECLQQKLQNHCYQNNELFKVKVGTVHSYQGEQVDVVIISTVGANADECNEEVNSPNNTNVYFTWARHCLWVIGDERMHSRGGSVWESLILEAKARKCFFQADEHKDLAKIIVEVKKDLHQLDELLSGETTLFRNTIWKVLFSSMFRTSFSNIESSETKKLIMLLLLKLSTGWRPKRSSTAASVNASPYFKLIKEFKVKGLHIICTIGVVKETHYTQVLKVWDILPFHDIANLVSRLDGIIGMYTHDYINLCKARCVQRGSEFPMQWPATNEIIQYKTQGKHCDEMLMGGENENSYVENVKVRESLILMKFFSLSTGVVNNMISGCDGGDLGLEFEITEQEKDVVSFDKSSFILGRSGTGKTTVLTMKLFQNEQLHHLACEGFHEVERNKEAKQDVLHQIFVTFSPKLCYAVKQHYSEWKRLTCGGSLSSQNSTVCIEDIDKMMLSEDIPYHFLQLPHDAYPLIITFHRFLLMLDGTVGTSYFKRLPGVRKRDCRNQASINSIFLVLEEYMRQEVTYERFCSNYWHHFNNKLTTNLDPATVYTEIMSVIKGGLTAGDTPNGILSRDDYVALCDARTSFLDARKREIIYSIFVQYEKKKLENGNFDLADLVNDLHQRLIVEGYKGDVMDYVYIDEVQDLSMRQIMLFKYVCKNVHQGFAFCGDTAQAIAKGIGFRFEDIRCLFYSKFLMGSEKGKMSKIFQLSENFRTHTGVLNLAQSVIDLLCHFFPLFVDVLSPETSRIGGELPTLLETAASKDAIKVIFERKADSSQQITGFGAEQVVLVRDESLKEKVVDIVGKNALVLTIMESKGLEFQDVLLYDFFTTSSFLNEWRIIYEYMKGKELFYVPSTAPSSCFDMEKHIVLCSELKQLYVAITRTRQRLWICETTGFSQPIYDYWKKLSLVNVKYLSDSFAEEMQIPSNKNEWRSRGAKLFYENNFRMAQLCFLKAGDKYSERLMEAYNLRAMADNARASQLERKKLLKDAAQLFNSIGKNELAADCFYKIEDYRTAGDIYVNKSMWEKAGNCYHLAKCYQLAVEVYEKAGAFIKCLSACSEGKLFEVGFELIGRWGGFVEEKLRFSHEGALYYFSVKNFVTMMKYVRSFRSKCEMRGFLHKRRCFDELILLEKEWGNFEEAAKIVDEAALYYFSVKNFVTMMKYVRSFRSKCEMRGFLHKRRCFDELILLEKEWGNFEEAAKIVDEAARYYFLVKNFVTMMKYVRSFRSKCEMRGFLHKRRCFDELILLEKEWGNFEEAAKIVDEAALYYFSVKNFVTMMKYVCSFRSKCEMRGFLHKRRCFDELILLEKEWGNFIEAAKVARMKPDPVLEADLFHMGGLHRESSLIILWHVFLNSQIFKIEPLKQKDELLRKAVLVAKRDSNVFYQFVCKEADILSQGKTKEELIKNGLEFIYCYKENVLAVNVECVKTIHEIKKVEKVVLDLMRSFFKSKNRLNELRILDEVCGDFVEAAKLSNEDDYSLEAALMRLWYVLFGSLWAHGERAWPLKDFTQKDKLLCDANSYVNYHPDSQDSTLMRTEISILSGAEISLSQMSKCLRETPRERSVRRHFLISRRILDSHLLLQNEDWTIKHLEAELSEDIVCLEGISYFWSYWKELIWGLIKWTFTWHHGCNSSKIYEAFIFNYFGVRKYDGDKDGCYVVLDAEAQWVKEMKPYLLRNGYLYIIHARQFSSVVSRYWCSELLFVAEKVFRELQSLHVYSTEKNFPVHLQTKILTSLFEVLKSLQKCKLPYSRNQASSIVDQYFRPCVEHFLTNVFHINWRIAQAKEMISLRGTETFRDMLKEAVTINRKSREGLTCGQMGRIAMIFLGSKVIGFNGHTKKKVRCCYSLNWRDLFTQLINGDRSTSKNWDLAISLHNVVKETFSAGFGRANDNTSPACFLYLLERLLILSFCFRGYVFTTRSSFVEWMAYEEWCMGSDVGCVTSLDTMKNIRDSLASMVIEMLNFQDALEEWVTKSEEPESSYPTLVLRLIVLLSLICANSGQYYDHLLDLLGRSHFVSLLPPAFCETLIMDKKEDRLVDAVAVACEQIDNPLVIVNFNEDFPKAPCQNAIVLNLKKLDFGWETLIEMLYNEKRVDAATFSCA